MIVATPTRAPTKAERKLQRFAAHNFQPLFAGLGLFGVLLPLIMFWSFATGSRVDCDASRNACDVSLFFVLRTRHWSVEMHGVDRAAPTPTQRTRFARYGLRLYGSGDSKTVALGAGASEAGDIASALNRFVTSSPRRDVSASRRDDGFVWLPLVVPLLMTLLLAFSLQLQTVDLAVDGHELTVTVRRWPLRPSRRTLRLADVVTFELASVVRGRRALSELRVLHRGGAATTVGQGWDLPPARSGHIVREMNAWLGCRRGSTPKSR